MRKRSRTPIPRDSRLDSTLALLSDGYAFIGRRCERYGTDVFETRLLLRKAICARGEDAARMFYHADRFTRKRAIPPTALTLLQDKGSVQQLSGDAHRARKRMFMALMTPESIAALARIVEWRWRDRLPRWQAMDTVVLLDEVQDILCRAACEWAGVPLSDADAARRRRELRAMIEGAGSVGARNLHGTLLRARTERWARGIVRRIRSGKLAVSEAHAARAIASHRDPGGGLLEVRVAGVELVNVLRPTVAVSWFIAFAALALHEHPQCRTRLEGADEDYLHLFVQEVRRFYPFFPLVGGRVAEPFDWRGTHFARGTWVLLDLYGTNHDPRTWDEPHAFRPERFAGFDGNPYAFIPQGGGDCAVGHRCAGEWLTIELVKVAVRLLVNAMRYDVPEQDLRIDLARIPALPESRFVIRHVRPRAAGGSGTR
jgi:fatty-acid peroxygenase